MLRIISQRDYVDKRNNLGRARYASCRTYMCRNYSWIMCRPTLDSYWLEIDRDDDEEEQLYDSGLNVWVV